MQIFELFFIDKTTVFLWRFLSVFLQHEEDTFHFSIYYALYIIHYSLLCSMFYLYENSATNGREACPGFKQWHTLPGFCSVCHCSLCGLSLVEKQQCGIGH